MSSKYTLSIVMGDELDLTLKETISKFNKESYHDNIYIERKF